MAASGAVDAQSLSPQQLHQALQELEQEIGYLTNSLKQLKAAQEKFAMSAHSLDTLTPENDGREVLVPLSGTMYAPGQLDAGGKVLVDVGTGYYLEKTPAGAKGFFERRADFLKEKIEQLQPQVMIKMKQKRTCEELLQAAMAQMQAKPGGK